MLLRLLVIVSLKIATSSAEICNAKLHPVSPRLYFDEHGVQQACPHGFIFSATTCLCTLLDHCYGPSRLPEGFRFQIPGSGLTCYTFIKCVGGATVYAHCPPGYRFEFHKGCVADSGCGYDQTTLQHSTRVDIFYPRASQLTPIIDTYGIVGNHGGSIYENMEPYGPVGNYADNPCQYKSEGYTLAHGGNTCYEYDVCLHFKPVRARCPSGYSYNSSMAGCMYDHTCYYNNDYNITGLCHGKSDYSMFSFGSYCSEYVVCSGGRSYYGRCPDYYSFRDGEGCVADRYCVPYRDQTGMCTPGMDSSMYSYHQYCYEYYVCYDGMAHYQRCPDGFAFDYNQGCVQDHFCRYKHIGQDPCSVLKDGARYASGGLCNEFYVCRHHTSVYQRCADHFAYVDHDCVENRYCTHRHPGQYSQHYIKKRAVDIYGYSRLFPTGYMDFCYERADGYMYDIGGFCYEFYACYQQMSYYATCPDGFRYVAFRHTPTSHPYDYYLMMNSSHAGGCVKDEYCRQYPNDMIAFEFCVGKSDNFTYSMGGFCNEYFICRHGKSIFQKCAQSFSFSDQQAKCVYDPHCKTFPPGYLSPDPCENLVDGQSYHNGGYCYEYYECWNKTSIYEQCPSGYKFDGIGCTHDADCYYEHHFKSDYCVGTPDGYSYAGGYCYEFNQCYMGTAYYKRCPENYRYDAATGDCKHVYDDGCVYNHHKIQDYCYNQPNGHTYQRNGNCYEYFLCEYGKSSYRRCAIGYSYKNGKGCVYDGECYYFHFYYQYYFYYYYYYYGGDAQFKDVLSGPYGANGGDHYHNMADPYKHMADPYKHMADPYKHMADPYKNMSDPYYNMGGHARRRREAVKTGRHDIQKRSRYEKHDFCADAPDRYTYNLGGHCYEYFTCMYGRSFYARCPDLHRFDVNKGCVYDQHCKITHDYFDNVCVNAPNFYTLSYGGYCFEYYFCYDNKTMYERCPSGYAYHQHSGCIEDSHCTFDLMLPSDICEHHPDSYKYSQGGHCYEYQQCYHGRSYYERCPNGRRFDGDTCVFDRKCTYLAKHRFYGTTKEAHKDFCEDKNDNFKYSFGTYCYDYYTCNGGRSYYQRCPHGQGFNGTQCVFDEKCYYHQHIINSNVQSDLCYNKQDGYSYSKGGYCFEYFVCDGTQSYYERCPGGQSYDAYNGRCVKDADCYHAAVISMSVDVCQLYKAGETFSRKTYCNEFYVCSQNKPLYQRCPNKYRYKYGVGCVKDDHCFHRTPILEHCRYNDDGYRYALHEHCWEYYECYGGRSYYHECPEGFRFDMFEDKCVRDASCKSNHYAVQDFCRNRPDYSRYSYGTHCYDYFECIHGNTYYERCPSGFSFDGSGCVREFQCELFETIVAPHSTNTKDVCQKSPDFSAYRGHGYCYDYYVCLNGAGHYERCPIGFAFVDGLGCTFDQYCNYHVQQHQSGHNDHCTFENNYLKFRTTGYCWEYQVCFGGRAYTQRCPVGHAFTGGQCVPDTECFHEYLIHYSIHNHEYGRIKRAAGNANKYYSNALRPVNLNYCKGKQEGYTYSIGGYCYEYFRCYDGQPMYMTCPVGDAYKQGKGCVHDDYCYHRQIVNTDFCHSGNSGKKYSYGGYCGDYYECRGGASVYERCPDYYRFDGSQCVHDETCHFYTPSYAFHDCDNQYDGFRFKYTGYCYEYYECHGGIALYQVCPFGHSFDGRTCSPDTRCYPQPSSISGSKYCADKPDGFTYSKGGFCDEYYTCSNGKATFSRCPAGSGYHGYKGCLPDASCKNRRKPPVNDPCTYLGEGTSYSLGEPCYEYYVCVNWVSQRRKCVSGKSYNFIAQQCVEDHKCMQTSVKTVCDGARNGDQYPADHCYGYFECRDGKATYLRCAKGFKFDRGSCRYDITRQCVQ